MDSLGFVEDEASPGGKGGKVGDLTGELGSGARDKFGSNRGELGSDGRAVKTLKALGDPYRSTQVEVD